jgi:hypothetical protein
MENTMIDFGTEAELFPTRKWKSTRGTLGYRRFPNTAEAVRFAIEELPPAELQGAFLQVDDERFDLEGIRKLYDSDKYPLTRRNTARL